MPGGPDHPKSLISRGLCRGLGFASLPGRRKDVAPGRSGGRENAADDGDHGGVHRSELDHTVALDRRRLEPIRRMAVMDTPVSEQGSSLELIMKRGALVCVVAMGGVAVGLAVWALRRWQDERGYQAWRDSGTADPYRRDRNGFPVGAQLGYSRR